eukprot:Em1080g2a
MFGSSPILAYPDHERRFILDADASDVGIGAVLSQVSCYGSECVIAYASRSLTRPEQRYCVTRKELLAVVEFIHHFRHYLLGREFTLRTDHGSLVWLRNFKEPEGQLARWLERLQEYNFTVVHRQGLRHCNADALSRIPCRQCGRDEAKNTAIVGVIITNPFQKYTPAEMRQMQMDDTTIQPVHLAVSCGERRTPDVLKSWDRSSRLLMEHWHALCICDGILWKKCVDGSRRYKQLVLPDRLQEEALRDLHQGAVGGHIGEEKMIHRLKERLYWPGCTEAVREWCRNCRSCATRKTTAPKRRAHLQTINAGYPMQIVSVDLMGPLPETEDGCKYVMEAKTVAKKLVDKMFCRFTPPEQLHSDQGRQFESELLKEICTLLHIRKTRTTPYHPQCNGMVALQEAYALVREHCQAEHRRQKELYDEKVHGKPFSPGESGVVALCSRSSWSIQKAATPYRKGPFKIMERLGEATYKITSLHSRRKSTIVHFDRLKPCVVPDVDDHTQSPENNILAEQVDRHRPVGTNLGLLDSDGETRVEPAEPVEAAPGIVVLPPLDEQRRYPVRDRQREPRSGVFYKDFGETIKAVIKGPSSADKNLRFFVKKSGFQILNIHSLGARDDSPCDDRAPLTLIMDERKGNIVSKL